jgi:hypothetical protein
MKMESGITALLVGLALIYVISIVPESWTKAAGGLLIAMTVAAVLIDVVLLLGH